ncbi:hypothetical protein DSL72_003609 [Monilinia vaccinii-corymbosi]|uniref:TPR domain-containing protein n=1 Tax=Monilinia vaccinii-corymbosi TaxID=61207 RepID=A0A8A3P843_9HELO|nr:hypothetical protein DSL72_003609 [Monilinia vaccinii-corymbosi]
MAKTKPGKKNNKDSKREKAVLNRTSAKFSKKASLPPANPMDLLRQATACLQEGDIEGAVPFAKKALELVDVQAPEALPALNLLGEIHVELGDVDSARQYFMQAAGIDEDGALSEDVGGGAEKFLWLAQLSEEGGEDSVGWYEKGAVSLKAQIGALLEKLEKNKLDDAGLAALEEKRRKLAVALCGVVEVYMTDLSWEEDAEQKCEALVTEATMVAPNYPEPWQTLANVRISQTRMEDAQAALKRSLEIWKDLPPENDVVPDFPTRVSLARLLMEADMDTEAIEVLERLVGEDDTSVEVWYLGGWGLYIMGEKQKNGESAQQESNGDGESWRISWISSQQWLNNCLRLFELQDYEDERLGAHARELVSILNTELGEEAANAEVEEDGEGGEGWEDSDDDDDDDEAMAGS